MSIANRLWGQSGFRFLDDFLKTVEQHYGAGLAQLDFAGATEAARKTINAWVAQKTEDRIRDLILPGIIDRATKLVLTNAIYFKGDWAEQFDKKQTAQAPFRVTPEKSVPVPMMRKTDRFACMSGEGLQAVELPYEGDALSMVVLLPEKVGGLNELEQRLTPENLETWLKSLHRSSVTVYLPRFTMTVRFEFSQTLAEMGMPLAFSGEADFSGMTGGRDLLISKVIHKAFVDVNEEGTEAAAATAVVMAPTGMPAPPVVFRADHPFVFLIRDRKTGSILFLGRVVDPTE